MNKSAERLSKNKDKSITIFLYISALLTGILWFIMALNSNVEYDGGYTIALIRHSFKEIIAITAVDVHSPLYYFIAKLGYHIFGNSIIGVKLASSIFCIGYILLGVFPLAKEFGKKFSTYFLLVSAFMPGLIFHMSDARMYGMATTAVTAVGILALLLYKSPRKLYNWVIFGLTSIFAMYIHTFAMLATFIIYVMLLLALIIKKKFKDKLALLGYGVNGIIVCLSYIPWLATLANQMDVRKSTYGNIIEKTTIFSIIDYIKEYFTCAYKPNYLVALLFSLLTLVSLIMVIVGKNRKKKYIFAGFMLFISINVIGHLVSVFYIPCFIGRYAIPCMGFVCALIAFAISSINKPVIEIIVLCLILLLGGQTYKEYFSLYLGDKDLKEYCEYLENNTDSNDAIIYYGIHSNYLTIYCPNRINYIYGYKDEFNPFPNYDVFIDFNQLNELTGDIYFVGWTKDDYSNTFMPFYETVKIMDVDYMYYNFTLYKLEPISDTY